MGTITQSIIRLPDKQSSETVAYIINWHKIIPSTDTLSGVAHAIFKVSDNSDVSSSMVAAEDFDATLVQAECDVQGGTDGEEYYLRARASTTGGLLFEQDYKFRVRDLGQ